MKSVDWSSFLEKNRINAHANMWKGIAKFMIFMCVRIWWQILKKSWRDWYDHNNSNNNDEGKAADDHVHGDDYWCLINSGKSGSLPPATITY